MRKFEISKYNAEIEIYNNRTFYLLPTYNGVTRANRGELKEYSLKLALTGNQLYFKDSGNYKTNSDIIVGDKRINVKSGECELGTMKNDNLQEHIQEYLAKDFSNTYIYITDNFVAYEMDKKEMEKFLLDNTRVAKTQNKRTSEIKYVCRLKRDSQISKKLEK